MRNKPFIIFFLIATLVGASMLCCCFGDQAHASVEAPECHQQEAAAPQQDTADCECDTIVSLAAKQFNGITTSFASNFSQIDNDLVSDFPSVLQYQRLSFRGFEGPSYNDSGPPLFIRHSVFRL